MTPESAERSETFGSRQLIASCQTLQGAPECMFCRKCSGGPLTQHQLVDTPDRQLHEWHWGQRWCFRLQSQQHQQSEYHEPIPSEYCTYAHLWVQLVDTKSVHNTTLLHFLERTVAKHFPDMESFLDELAAPAEAYRGTYAEKKTVHGFIVSPSEPAGC